MFDIELMNFNPEAPSFLVMFITALFAFFLSSIIAVTYQFTTRSIYRKAHFLQSLALIGVVAATILQAIGESVAIGLGIIGALSIIRFRTSLTDPRNITFMFASIGSGIACGVMGFGIALTGTLTFCVGAIILKFSPLNNNNELIGELKIHIPEAGQLRHVIEQKLNILCNNHELIRLRFVNSKKMNGPSPEETEVVQVINRIRLQELIYLISLKDSYSLVEFEESMKDIEGLESLRLDFRKRQTRL